MSWPLPSHTSCPIPPLCMRVRKRCGLAGTAGYPQRVTDEPTLAALLRASRVITAIVVRSLMAVSPAITIAQARLLVFISGAGSANVNAVAEALGVNASNASRAADRLVRAGLLRRTQPDEDRRHVVLELSADGQALLASVMRQRGAELER